MTVAYVETDRKWKKTLTDYIYETTGVSPAFNSTGVPKVKDLLQALTISVTGDAQAAPEFTITTVIPMCASATPNREENPGRITWHAVWKQPIPLSFTESNAGASVYIETMRRWHKVLENYVYFTTGVSTNINDVGVPQVKATLAVESGADGDQGAPDYTVTGILPVCHSVEIDRAENPGRFTHHAVWMQPIAVAATPQ